jgi:hypothetical protein
MNKEEYCDFMGRPLEDGDFCLTVGYKILYPAIVKKVNYNHCYVYWVTDNNCLMVNDKKRLSGGAIIDIDSVDKETQDQYRKIKNHTKGI